MQLTVQSTPAFAESLLTVAEIEAVPLTARVAGGACVMEIEIGAVAEVIVTVAVALLLLSVVEKAVMLTVLPVGTADGGVYIVVAPLAVCVVEKDPQAPALPQLTAQSTPAFAESFVTVAASAAVAPICNEAGGTCVSATEMMGVVTWLEPDPHPETPKTEAITMKSRKKMTN